MSVDQWILRIGNRVDYYQDGDPQILPLPDAAEVERRLLGVKGVKRTSRGELYFKGPDGRVPLSVGPERIAAEGCAPSDLLPLVKALKDLGYIVVYDPQEECWYEAAQLEDTPDLSPARPFYGPPIHPPPAADGFVRMEWAAPLLCGCDPLHRFAYDGVFLLDTQGERRRMYVTALDARTGQTVWTMFLPHPEPQLAMLGDVLVAMCPPTVYGLDPKTGGIRWQRKLTGRRNGGFPDAEIDLERGTITVCTGSSMKYRDASEIDSRGNLLSRTRRSSAELRELAQKRFAEGKRKQGIEVLMAPGRPMWGCVAVDEQRGIHFMGAHHLSPPRPRMGTRAEDSAWWAAMKANARRMKFVLFDRATGDALAEQEMKMPESLPFFTPDGPIVHTTGDRVCVIYAANAFGFSIHPPG